MLFCRTTPRRNFSGHERCKIKQGMGWGWDLRKRKKDSARVHGVIWRISQGLPCPEGMRLAVVTCVSQSLTSFLWGQRPHRGKVSLISQRQSSRKGSSFEPPPTAIEQWMGVPVGKGHLVRSATNDMFLCATLSVKILTVTSWGSFCITSFLSFKKK